MTPQATESESGRRRAPASVTVQQMFTAAECNGQTLDRTGSESLSRGRGISDRDSDTRADLSAATAGAAARLPVPGRRRRRGPCPKALGPTVTTS